MLHFHIFLLFSPHLEYSAQLWDCQPKDNKTLSEQVQRRAMKTTGELEYLSHEDRLRELNLAWRVEGSGQTL